jgi:hypothetical protein
LEFPILASWKRFARANADKRLSAQAFFAFMAISAFGNGLAAPVYANEVGRVSYAPDAPKMPAGSGPNGVSPGGTFLQGGVSATDRLPPPSGLCQARGFSAYQQGWYALGHQQFQVAADYFQIAGDQLEAGTGQSRFVAEARFAEAQCRRMMGQYDRSADLYKRAIAIFQQVDPTSFYLRAAHQALTEMGKAAYAPVPTNKPLKGQVKKQAPPSELKPLFPNQDTMHVAQDVVLSSRVTKLDNGTSILNLADGAFFNRSRGMLTQTAAVDVSENYVNDCVKKAFLKMNCLEMTTLGATHYSAASSYKAIKSGGVPIAVGGGNDLTCPVAELKLNGKMHKVPMDLPHISPNSKNVLLVTDGRHVLAVDPRTNDTWKLCANFSRKIPDFNWWKLGRQKGRKFS